jgi:hypothetical protein
MPSTNRPLSPLLPTAAPRSAGVDNEQLDTGSPTIDDPVPAKEDTEAIRLVQNLRTGNQSHVSHMPLSTLAVIADDIVGVAIRRSVRVYEGRSG